MRSERYREITVTCSHGANHVTRRCKLSVKTKCNVLIGRDDLLKSRRTVMRSERYREITVTCSHGANHVTRRCKLSIKTKCNVLIGRDDLLKSRRTVMM
ncbi:hypothetical protein AVEN_17475-1 [Araneus ventricosus]|uniref:Uncharacterized protein n=1 Tax=Araneus ventricosus TaxID=182803 RepID=A0A4Y2V315_ARAVE|nr:hypothetical protein AVEN_17475-1 [Araneus ventricosus]